MSFIEVSDIPEHLLPKSDFDTYQDFTDSTAKYAEAARKKGIPPILYCALKLAGEAGEVAEKLGKWIRDSEDTSFSPEFTAEMIKELGDVQWYVAQAARQLGSSLSLVAARNMEKLQSRKDRGVISGSGDNR